MKFFLLFLIVLCAVCVSSLKISREAIMKPFLQKNAFKVISGLNNFDAVNVRAVCEAAKIGRASHVDIACDPVLVKSVKSMLGNSIPVCVSSVVPVDFLAAVSAGADMVEIGNFDSFYEKGIKFSAEDVVKLTVETRSLLPNIPLSVTIPHTLSLAEQVVLAQRLEEAGADILQTEGKVAARLSSVMGVQEMIEVAAPTLASAFALTRAVSIPVMCSSGLTDITAPLAMAVGAGGVGVGSSINKLQSLQQMILAVTAISDSINRPHAESSCEGERERESESECGVSKVSVSKKQLA